LAEIEQTIDEQDLINPEQDAPLEEASNNLLDTLPEEKIDELSSFLTNRFDVLKRARQTIDTEVAKEQEKYHGKDDDIDEKAEYESKIKENYLWDLIQTMIGRLIQTLFPEQNYLKIYTEQHKYKDIEKTLTKWVQEELDRLKLRARSRDFLEEALTGRLAWLHLRPVPTIRRDADGGPVEGHRVEFDIFTFFDVWFDTTASQPENSDYFVKKTKKLYELYENKEIYRNLDQIEASTGGDDDDAKIRDIYEAKHSSLSEDNTTPTEPEKSQGVAATDEVELLEYYGVVDFSDGQPGDPDWEPDIQEVICTLANRRTLIRAEINTLPTKRKRLMFPIRPLRQSKSLLGKSVPQLMGDKARDLNEMLSLQMDNFKMLIKLLFTYNKNADIDLGELFAGDGNAIGWDETPNDVLPMKINNVLNEAELMIQRKMASMQGTAGTPDILMGQSGGRGAPETAAGINTGQENALFRFNLLALNVADDLIEFVKYVIIILVQNNPGAVFNRHPALNDFLNLPAEELELDYVVDIGLKDLSTRREVERAQWANMAGILGPMLQQAGGNMTLFVKRILEVFGVPDLDRLMSPENPMDFVNKLMANPQLLQQVMTIVNQVQAEAAGGQQNVGSTPGVPTPASVAKTQEQVL